MAASSYAFLPLTPPFNMNRLTLLLPLIMLLAGCTGPTAASDEMPEVVSSLRATYAVTGVSNGTLQVQVLAPQETLDSRLQERQAVPVIFSAWDEEGEPKSYRVFWLDGDWTIVRADEYCHNSWDPCTHSRTLFGARGAPPPFGIGHTRLWDEPRTTYIGSTADLAPFVTSSSATHITYETDRFLNEQHYQLPKGTFHYDGGLLPTRFEGRLIPFGEAEARLVDFQEGEAFSMPPRWEIPSSNRQPVTEGLFFPGDEADLLDVGTTVHDAWEEITDEKPELVDAARQGCINTVSISDTGGSPGYAAGVEEYNFTTFSFTVDEDGMMGREHRISTNEHWLHGRQWIMQESRDQPSYGRCPYETERVPAVVNASEFLAQARELPHRGQERGMGAIYWDDVVQPFGINHEQARLVLSFRPAQSLNPYYLEMDITSASWYRFFGHPDDLAELGALPWKGLPARGT